MLTVTNDNRRRILFMKYSIVIPIYNRPDEAEELLESLSRQRYQDFELVMVEDGSTQKCDHVVEKYNDKINIRYFYKENTGPGKSRNYGIENALGEYVILFDSDCIIPEDYLEKIEEFQKEFHLDCWGGPDAAHESFSDIQKAINFAMTSFITTGGIRGRKKQLDKFQPRSFNMGFKKEIYNKIGGFSNVHPGEDPDFSYRIMNAGYTTGLIPNAKVFHKRRIDFGKYRIQVYKFGVVRNFLIKWYPDKFKLVYLLPSFF
jgi:glycosyltransferase involved in cell wall biosynthesis